MIHEQAQSIGYTAAGAGDLIALSAVMKDASDEILVLRGLRTWLTALARELPHSRQIINSAMVLCSNSSVVNAKGQAVLNALADWDEPVALLSRRVARVVPE